MARMTWVEVTDLVRSYRKCASRPFTQNGSAAYSRLPWPQEGPVNGIARENRPPADYLNKSYYEIWLAGLETLLAERGLVSADEIVAGHPLGEPKRVDGILRQGDVETLLYRGRPTERPASDPARFRIGDRIRAKNIHPATHTRLPRYVRGRADRKSVV